MFCITVCVLDVIAAYFWGDWRNWKTYHSTILYMITCDLLYNFITYQFPMWEYTPTILYPNHTIISMIAMFVAYPSMILIFLGRFPSNKMNQLLWISLWVLLWTFFEWIGIKVGEFRYFNGWSLTWSFFFNIVLFTMLWLHYKKPLLTYGLSVMIIAFLLMNFHVPIKKLK